jgi:hypothetical protein
VTGQSTAGEGVVPRQGVRRRPAEAEPEPEPEPPPAIEAIALTVRECLAHLRTATIGRLVYTDRALPAIRPVRFVLDDEDVLVRTGLTGEISTMPGEVVAFEADQLDPVGLGWTVVVVGPARPVPGEPVGPGLRVHIEQISGHRLRAIGERRSFPGPVRAHRN